MNKIKAEGQQGNKAIRQQGNKATRQQGNKATRQQGNKATRQQGNKAIRQKIKAEQKRRIGQRLRGSQASRNKSAALAWLRFNAADFPYQILRLFQINHALNLLKATAAKSININAATNCSSSIVCCIPAGLKAPCR